MQKLINFHIKLGKLVAVFAMLLIGGQAWGASYSVCTSGCDKATPQAAFDEIALSSGDTVTITGDYSAAILDLSGVAETGTIYISGVFNLGKVIGKSNLSLIGNGARIEERIELGNNAKMQGFVVTILPIRFKTSDGEYFKVDDGYFIVGGGR
jgi:hypothetical protein